MSCAQLSKLSRFVQLAVFRAMRYTNEIYTKACKEAGVWAKVEQDQAEAEKREACNVSPVPDSASAVPEHEQCAQFDLPSCDSW